MPAPEMPWRRRADASAPQARRWRLARRQSLYARHYFRRYVNATVHSRRRRQILVQHFASGRGPAASAGLNGASACRVILGEQDQGFDPRWDGESGDGVSRAPGRLGAKAPLTVSAALGRSVHKSKNFAPRENGSKRGGERMSAARPLAIVERMRLAALSWRAI